MMVSCLFHNCSWKQHLYLYNSASAEREDGGTLRLPHPERWPRYHSRRGRGPRGRNRSRGDEEGGSVSSQFRGLLRLVECPPQSLHERLGWEAELLKLELKNNHTQDHQTRDPLCFQSTHRLGVSKLGLCGGGIAELCISLPHYAADGLGA